MGRLVRVSFSGENLDLSEINQYYEDIAASIRNYFSPINPRYEIRFFGYTPDEIYNEMRTTLEEHERNSAMNILAALEATFRVDFLQRCYKRRKDLLSRALRDVHKQKGIRVSLEDDIFSAWKDNSPVVSSILSDLRGAFKYRHWLAHGRYWEPKLGRKYDYQGIYVLAKLVFDNFPFEGTPT